MSNKAHISIKDFFGKGKNLKTPIETWEFGFPNNTFSWSSAMTRLPRPLIIGRRKDKLSHYFAGIALRNNMVIDNGGMNSKETFAEVSLVLGVYNNNRGLVSQIVYDLFEVEVIHYSEAMGRETIRFNFERAYTLTTSVEKITSP